MSVYVPSLKVEFALLITCRDGTTTVIRIHPNKGFCPVELKLHPTGKMHRNFEVIDTIPRESRKKRTSTIFGIGPEPVFGRQQQN
jgi:hypothetical protein